MMLKKVFKFTSGKGKWQSEVPPDHDIMLPVWDGVLLYGRYLTK